MKPRFVGVEADETPADRDVVQLAEDFLGAFTEIICSFAKAGAKNSQL